MPSSTVRASVAADYPQRRLTAELAALDLWQELALKYLPEADHARLQADCSRERAALATQIAALPSAAA